MTQVDSNPFFTKNLVSSFGKSVLNFLSATGAVGLLFFAVMKAMFRYPQRRRTLILQMYSIGFQSLPVVVLTGLAIGMVLGVQLLVTLQAFKGETMTGAMVNFALFSQLGPTLTGLMLAGRVGSSIAAELGTMKVTEQIDALRTMGTDPVAYLVVPRFLACVCLLPFLTAIASAAGVFGSAWLLTYVFEVPSASYWERAIDFNSWWEITTGLIKTCVFGGLIALVACRAGLNTTGGATGVGRSCTEGVVSASILILLSNFVMTLIVHITQGWVFP